MCILIYTPHSDHFRFSSFFFCFALLSKIKITSKASGITRARAQAHPPFHTSTSERSSYRIPEVETGCGFRFSRWLGGMRLSSSLLTLRPTQLRIQGIFRISFVALPCYCANGSNGRWQMADGRWQFDNNV